MSMSTHVVGFVPPDERWAKMKAVWDASRAAGVEVPREVERFFGGEAPDDNGREVELPVMPWHDAHGGREGYELDVALIPKEVRVIRFYNSW